MIECRTRQGIIPGHKIDTLVLHHSCSNSSQYYSTIKCNTPCYKHTMQMQQSKKKNAMGQLPYGYLNSPLITTFAAQDDQSTTAFHWLFWHISRWSERVIYDMRHKLTAKSSALQPLKARNFLTSRTPKKKRDKYSSHSEAVQHMNTLLNKTSVV